MRRLVRVDPPSSRRVTRADRALTEMYEHLTWLRERRSPSGHEWFQTDVAREVGLTEAMDILRKHGARLIEPDQNAPTGTTDHAWECPKRHWDYRQCTCDSAPESAS